ncbi:MAG: zinc dependent phospholipase C family protein [Deltaproteobacteria bacterium]|nr:zinc dependent phospholipase C family protein [Deltaproteobacteria bacterium]
MILYGVFAALVYFLLPASAFAWGPGAHISYALYALANAAVLAPPIRSLLKKFPETFLYGTIAADIIFGKKYAGELYHCHHWDVALPLLDRAETERERAFIYGYLGHLSVDTVAHNFYVPYKIIRSFETLTLRHTYWEMRFDLKMDPKVWKSLEDLGEGEYVELDRFLEKSLKRTIFSFKTNKKIFDSLMLVQRMNKWRGAAELLAKRSDYELEDRDVREYQGLCHEVLIEFLQGPEKARVLRADPAGQLKLLYAKEMVKDLRSYTRRGLISLPQAKGLVSEIKSQLKEGIYKPVDLPVITDAI